MLCFIEPLGLPAGVLRPGNATTNNATDQLAALQQQVNDEQLAIAAHRRLDLAIRVHA